MSNNNATEPQQKRSKKDSESSRTLLTESLEASLASMNANPAMDFPAGLAPNESFSGFAFPQTAYEPPSQASTGANNNVDNFSAFPPPNAFSTTSLPDGAAYSYGGQDVLSLLRSFDASYPTLNNTGLTGSGRLPALDGLSARYQEFHEKLASLEWELKNFIPPLTAAQYTHFGD